MFNFAGFKNHQLKSDSILLICQSLGQSLAWAINFLQQQSEQQTNKGRCPCPAVVSEMHSTRKERRLLWRRMAYAYIL